MQYNWQHPDWPNFYYQADQSRQALYQYALEAGRLSGGMSQLEAGSHDEAYIDLMVNEAINTSEIEGERLNREDVRSSIKNYLGLSTTYVRIADPRAEGIASLIVDVRKTFNQPLTKQKLFQWQQMAIVQHPAPLLRPAVATGQWRTTTSSMQIVSGAIGYEKVHFEAPPSSEVDSQMTRFIEWFNASHPATANDTLIPGPVRAAIAHLWFESIHPFEDGNGRVGRAIVEQALAQDLGHPPLLSLSSEIEKDRNGYYDTLNAASKASMDITPWVNWFADAVLRAQKDAATKVDFILKKAKFWDCHDQSEPPLNERQHKVISKLFKAGPEGFEFGLSAKKYMAMSGCSKATATRDLADLLARLCLYRLEGGGRNARYGLKLDL
jgi:Fic family protein